MCACHDFSAGPTNNRKVLDLNKPMQLDVAMQTATFSFGAGMASRSVDQSRTAPEKNSRTSPGSVVDVSGGR